MFSISEFYDHCDQVKANITKLTTKAAALRESAETLKTAGITTSKPTYRDGKYLYLVGPMVDGSRTREYVGSDPAKIAEALAKVDRQKQYDELKNELAGLERRLSGIQSDLIRLVDSSNPRSKRF